MISVSFSLFNGIGMCIENVDVYKNNTHFFLSNSIEGQRFVFRNDFTYCYFGWLLILTGDLWQAYVIWTISVIFIFEQIHKRNICLVACCFRRYIHLHVGYFQWFVFLSTVIGHRSQTTFQEDGLGGGLVKMNSNLNTRPPAVKFTMNWTNLLQIAICLLNISITFFITIFPTIFCHKN